jgi:tetratricopeptide (TPR) repeat protein
MKKNRFPTPSFALRTAGSAIYFLFFICCWLFAFSTDCRALGLDNLRNHFLSGDYKACIREGEKLIAQSGSGKGLDELYYILGLSYLKDGNSLRASDIFEIVINEYRNSKFQDEAKLGLGDSYFLRRDYGRAQDSYGALLKDRPQSKLKPAIYYRLSQLGKRTADKKKEQEFLAKLKSEFPRSPEALTAKEFLPGPMIAPAGVIATPATAPKPSLPEKDIILAPLAKPASSESTQELITGSFSVQVGAFSSLENARKLTLKLKAQRHSAYISEAVSVNKKIYKVRIGGFSSRQEAKEAEKKFKALGYPTTIIP